MKTQAQEMKREDHMEAAAVFALAMIGRAELRGISAADLVVSIASVLAARNPTLAGKVLASIDDAIMRQPVTKVIQPKSDVVWQ